MLEYLKDLTAEFHKIGTAFRLKSDTLKSIKQESADNMEATIRIVDSWLKLNYNWQRFGKPSWRALVEAVASPIGGGNVALAMKIAKKHKISG